MGSNDDTHHLDLYSSSPPIRCPRLTCPSSWVRKNLNMVKKTLVSKRKVQMKKKRLIKAQMTHLVSFGPVFVVPA